MGDQNALNFSQFRWSETALSSQGNRRQPVFRFIARLANMHVRRFIQIGGIEPESVASDAQDNGHELSIAESLKSWPAAAFALNSDLLTY